VKNQTQISCTLHDYIEIACMHRYDVKLHLDTGLVVTGRATSTRAGADKAEYFVLVDSGEILEVPMHQLVRMESITPGASFNCIEFRDR
jgi:Rho-binding antiterminator